MITNRPLFSSEKKTPSPQKNPGFLKYFPLHDLIATIYHYIVSKG